MPFGLRNAWATYQRLVDKAFHKQIGRNLEVYMDDLVIKSRTEDEIARDIAETFKTLKEINMKLNPKKCTFGVEEGMFLGYNVNTKGLKVCPDKVDTVLSLPSPKCLKDVQKLNGKLASLNRETPKVLLLAWEKFFEIKHAFKEKQHQLEDIQELLHKILKDVQIISEELADYINTPNWNCPAFYDNDDEDDDEEYTIVITPVLPTMEPDNPLSMGDEHLSTIPEKKESSVEDLVPIPSESKGISDNMCDVPFCETSHPLDALKDHSEIFFDPNNDYASSDDDPLYTKDIDYVDASPPDSELVSLEEVKDFNTEDGEIDTDILLTIKDDILHEKLLNINLLIAKIEALKDNPTPSTDSVLMSPSSFPNSFLEETDTSNNSLPESEIFCFDMEEKSSGNPTSHSDISLLDYEAFYCDNEPIRKFHY
ncbi:hypothetical protein Tco_0744201 [Tanacetum coccineum]